MTVLLSELLPPARIRIPLRGTDKHELLEELVALLADESLREDVLRAVRAREEVLSTGIGNGVAIPHARSQRVSGLRMAAGVVPGGVDFDALDGRPVRLFFLLIGPELAAGDHVKALSRISRLVRSDSFRSRLIEAPDPEAFHSILSEAEQS